MASVRLASVQVTSAAQALVRLAGVKAAVTAAQPAPPPTASLRLAKVLVTVSSAPPPTASLRLARVQVQVLSTPDVTARASVSPVTAEPWEVVTLNGAGSTGAVDYAWSQTGGTPVTLSGTGASRTFPAPASVDGETLYFALVASGASGATSRAAVSVPVLATTEFVGSGGQWLPLQVLSTW